MIGDEPKRDKARTIPLTGDMRNAVSALCHAGVEG
jgi:hypothetical protein